MEAVKIILTEKHWDVAQKYRNPSGACSTSLCLVSQALIERFPGNFVSTGVYACRVGEVRFKLDKAGVKAVEAFDKNKKPKFPIEVELTKLDTV